MNYSPMVRPFKLLFFLALLTGFSLNQVSPAHCEIRLGILAKRGAIRVFSQWGPTASYLSQELGEPVVIIPIPFDLIETMVKKGRIEFLLANSGFFVDMEKRYQTRAIATLINAKNSRPLDQFGGVLFTRKDSAIRKLTDLRGKKLMIVDRSSFGGGQMALRLLLDNNITPEKELTLLAAGTHDNVVQGVLKGIADAGTVRTDTLERMEAEGLINMDELRIIHPVDDTFAFVHSTRLYPEWPMAALKQTPTDVSERMSQALQRMDARMPASKAAYILGWKKPADYSSVWHCLEIVNGTVKAP